MALVDASKHSMVAREAEEAQHQAAGAYTSFIKSREGINITRLPTDDDVEAFADVERRSTFHVYQKHEVHKCISPISDPSKERWWGPTVGEHKTRRKEKKERKNSRLPPVEPDDNAFFLHSPYLAFHAPPRVLYVGNTKHAAKPAVLIHEGCFWREYKLQLGPSIARSGVMDPRGVVAWKHHGGDKEVLKLDDKKLKGYKVRPWRLWGETGKAYVHSVKKNRKAGTGPDPDVVEKPATADEVVYLRWMNPFSQHTRRYRFCYAGVDFYWKGTSTVKESRLCGPLLRFNHLKLVARLPSTSKEKEEDQPEVCLGRYTSSVASKKNGTLEFFDAAIVRIMEEHALSMLAQDPFEGQRYGQENDEASKVARMKRSTLYQVLVATAMCMIVGEKEKRHTLLGLLVGAAEGGGGAGG